MKPILINFLISLLVFANPVAKATTDTPVKIAIIWEDGKPSGEIEVSNCELDGITIITGKGKIKGNKFTISSDGPVRIELTLSNIILNPGPGSSLVQVKTTTNAFTFFVRDINKSFPVFIPEFSVAVTEQSDNRSFAEIGANISSQNLKSKFDNYENEPEENYANASEFTRDQKVPTLLGLSRDFRMFRIEQSINYYNEMSSITPLLASTSVPIKQNAKQGLSYGFVMGRGEGTTFDNERKLEGGSMPILHTILRDEDITYHSIAFASLEFSELSEATVRGTHYLVADNYCDGTTFTDTQKQEFNELEEKELNQDEEVVLYFRCEAVNNASVPRYAFFKAPRPGTGWWFRMPYNFEPSTGFSGFNDSIFCISMLNGLPLSHEEMAILLQPGEKAIFDFYLPNRPISVQRAQNLSQQNFIERLKGCKEYWKIKEGKAAFFQLPEIRINEMLYAGLNHLDLITYGIEPSGPLAPSIGVYSPIGSESSPIIQYYMSMGLFDQAKRSIQYFLDKQHEDGMMQNFGGYMIETGAVLWTMGEYYRYTRDNEWIEESLPELKKACDFLINWRKANMSDELIGKGYGMIAGKVADPDDEFHQFMLNGYAYIGISRAAEITQNIDQEYSKMLQEVADSWKENIREAFYKSRAGSPVVPLGDGRWSPTVPPWTEASSPAFLYTETGNYFSHGTFFTRDGLLGPLHLVYTEVFDPEEDASGMMLDYYSEIMMQRNAGFSQPYYYPHAWIELKRGMVKPFLKTYYNTFTGLSDRETYSFWEHYYRVSPHKTHEEAWFLMQTRWMLYLEEVDTLNLLSGIPRAWLQDGQSIIINDAASYFGKFSLNVNSLLKSNTITAEIKCQSDRSPKIIKIRLPHPEGHKAKAITGGVYDSETECVTVELVNGISRIELGF